MPSNYQGASISVSKGNVSRKQPRRRINRLMLASAPAAMALSVALFSQRHAAAQLYTWDPSGTGGSDVSGNWDLSTSNWYSGSLPDVLWPNASGSGSLAQFGSGGSGAPVSVNLNAVGIVTNGMIFNNGPVYTITGNAADALTLGGSFPTITVNAASANVSAVLAGTGGMTVAGTGTLTLSGANTYAGTTFVNSGTLQLNSGGTLGSTTNALVLGNTSGTLSSAANVTFNTSATIGSFNCSTQSATNSFVIAAGSTVVDNGAFYVGLLPSNLSSNQFLNSYVGTEVPGSGGELDVNGSMTIGFNPGAANKVNATVDLSGLSTLKLNASTGVLNLGGSTNIAGLLTLANNTNFVNVGTVNVGVSDAAGFTGNENAQNGSTLTLGQGTNTIEAGSIVIGGGKANGIVQFNSSNGSVSITGTGGTGVANITISNGNVASSSASSAVSSLLLAGHTANVSAGTVVIGNYASAAKVQSVGTATFDTGTFNMSSLQLAVVTGSVTLTAAGGSTGTFTLGTSNTSTGVLNVSNSFVLASNTNTQTSASFPPAAIGTFNLLGGTANISANITVPSNTGTGTGTTSAVFNLFGGTLNMGGFAIGGTGAVNKGNGPVTTFNFPGSGQTATLENLGGAGINATGGTGAATGGVVMGGAGTLILAGNNTYSGPTTINSGATLQIGSGTLGGSVPAASVFTNNGMLNFGGSVPITIGSNISGSGPVNHNGTSTVTLTGSNSYQGSTTIYSGVLAVNGSLLSTGTVSINPLGNAGGGVLAGIGSVGGVTLNTGGAIHPGASGADGNIGTLTLTSLAATGDLRFDIGGASSDVIADGGAANLTGATVSIALDSPASMHTYTVLTATGGLTGMPTLTTSLIGRTGFALSEVGNSLVVTVTGNPANLVWGKIGGTGDGVTWEGSLLNQNWNHSGSPDYFYNDDLVSFTDGNNGHNTVTVSGQVMPGSVTFSNNAQNYLINGTGAINGSTGVLLNGTGSVTIQNANAYTGDTNINSGTLILGTGGSIADTNLNVNGGSFNVAGGTLNSTNLNVNGGVATIASGSVASSNINVASGSLTVGAGGAITATSGLVAVASGASMTVANGGTLPSNLGVTDNGTVTLNTPVTTIGTLNGSGVVTLNSVNLIVGNGGTVAGMIQDGSGAGSLSVTGGVLTLTGSNNYSGPTSISTGATLQVGNNTSTGSLNAASSITVAGTLAYNTSGTTTVTNAIANTGTVLINGSGTVNMNSTITGAGSFMTAGTGNVVLSTANLAPFTGPFNITGGTLTFNYSSPTTIPNPVTAGGNGTIANVGKLTMTGTETFTTPILTYNVTAVAGTMPDGVPADVELIGSLNRAIGDGNDITKTGAGTLAISGSGDNVSLGVTVNQGTLLLNKNSSSAAHAIGGGGLTINNGGIVRLTGTGGDQIYNGAGQVTINDGGLFDMNGQNEQVFGVTLGSSTNGSGGTLEDSVAGSASVLIIGLGATGSWRMNGNGNIYVPANTSLEVQTNAPSTGPGGIFTTTGPGTVILTGTGDANAINANVSMGTLILAKSSSAADHALSSIVGVSPGALLQLGSNGSGGDQLYDGYLPGSNNASWGVFNMNGTFDLNGLSEGFDKLTGTGNIINSQSGSQSGLTLGTNNDIGTTISNFAGTISGNIALTKAGTSLTANTILSGSNSYTGATTVNAGILTLSSKAALPLANPGAGFYGTSLTIQGQGTVVASPMTTPTALQVSSLSDAGLIDLNNNALDVNAGSASLSTITQLVSFGYNGGGWNGTSGITSTTAANDTAHLTALGVILNDNGAGKPFYGSAGTIAPTFEGTTPQIDDVLVKYTYYGDTNLDGKVDGSDYSRMDAGYAADQAYLTANPGGTSFPATGWFNGDFNYDGVVDGSDYTLMDNAFNSQGAQLATAIASPTAQIGSSAVPEPTTLALIGIAATGLLGRRRSRK